MKESKRKCSVEKVLIGDISHSSDQMPRGDIAMKSKTTTLSAAERGRIKDEVIKAILLDVERSGAKKPARGTILGDALIRFTNKISPTHDQMAIEEVPIESIMAKLTAEDARQIIYTIIKEILLDMEENGEDKPARGTILGNAFIAFTTKPKKR